MQELPTLGEKLGVFAHIADVSRLGRALRGKMSYCGYPLSKLVP